MRRREEKMDKDEMPLSRIVSLWLLAWHGYRIGRRGVVGRVLPETRA